MKAVIFDIDGTLIQSANVDDELYRQSVIELLGPVRFRPSLSDYRRVTDSGVLMEVLEDNDLRDIPDPTEPIQARFVELLEDYVAQHGPFAEIPGAKEFIEAHRQSERHAVAIATGGWRLSALLKLQSAGFDVGGVPIATSDDHHDRHRDHGYGPRTAWTRVHIRYIFWGWRVGPGRERRTRLGLRSYWRDVGRA